VYFVVRSAPSELEVLPQDNRGEGFALQRNVSTAIRARSPVRLEIVDVIATVWCSDKVVDGWEHIDKLHRIFVVLAFVRGLWMRDDKWNVCAFVEKCPFLPAIRWNKK
jgi:hypothetical protein